MHKKVRKVAGLYNREAIKNVVAKGEKIIIDKRKILEI